MACRGSAVQVRLAPLGFQRFEDHINALILVATSGKILNTYCVGGHGEISNKDLILKICEIMVVIFPAKSPHNRLIKFVEDRPGDDLRYSIDPTKI